MLRNGTGADPAVCAMTVMELAGLEPATSWVRSNRPLTPKVLRLQRFRPERLECRNISRNSLHRVLQRHEILDRLLAPSKRSAGEHLHSWEGLERSQERTEKPK